MNKQSRDNRLYVRHLLWKKNPDLAEELEWIKFSLDWEEFFSEFWPCPVGHHETWPDAFVVGFGDCETDIPGRFGADELL